MATLWGGKCTTTTEISHGCLRKSALLTHSTRKTQRTRCCWGLALYAVTPFPPSGTHVCDMAQAGWKPPC